MTRLNKNMLDG